MLYAQNVSCELWAEAVSTAVYILNRTFLEKSVDVTPYENWFGIKPNIKNKKLFGAVAYMHCPKELAKKWTSRSRKIIFVGYEKTHAIIDSEILKKGKLMSVPM
ncbi:hypothetical protein JTB14_015283 [Gonioctena quinquepunctata]|nr:hypothetical protein JTB14_015283 [Gonioctena quinquepunctata]